MIIQRIISNLIWEFLILILSFIFYKFFWKILYSSYKISKFLLIQNRPAVDVDNYPSYLADRFIEIRYNSSDRASKYIKWKEKYFTINIAHLSQGKSPSWNNLSDDILIKEWLIEVYKDKNWLDKVRPINNMRNMFIIQRLISYLVKYCWDNKSYYDWLKNK